MATTHKRICIEDHTIKEDSDVFTIERGKEYITSPVLGGGVVNVFSTYWAYGVPISIFAGAKLFTGGNTEE